MFEVRSNRFKFGPGLIDHTGEETKALGVKRVFLVADPQIGKLDSYARVRDSLKRAQIDVVEYNENVSVEPTDVSFLAAGEAAREAGVDGFVSMGGGSVMDTTKAAALLSRYPDDILAYCNAPIGQGKAVPGPVAPHLAIPTTPGTGAEATGYAICDVLSMHAKTGIASRALIPTAALVDPEVVYTCPTNVIVASGFDVLSHAVESYCARPFTDRPRAYSPMMALGQGRNPFSDFGCLETLRLVGQYFMRAVEDPSDTEARTNMHFAATLAGVAIGNAGTALPHGMSYAVSGLVEADQIPYCPDGYKDRGGFAHAHPLVPHGMAVISCAPSSFRKTFAASPERHLEAARLLGGDVRTAHGDDAGEVLADVIIDFMRKSGLPNGLKGIGFTPDDVPRLVARAAPQRRVMDNAPITVNEEVLADLFKDSMTYW